MAEKNDLFGILLAGLGVALLLLILSGGLSTPAAGAAGRLGTHLYLPRILGYALSALAVIAGIALLLAVAWSALALWVVVAVAVVGIFFLGKLLALVAAAILGVALYVALSNR